MSLKNDGEVSSSESEVATDIQLEELSKSKTNNDDESIKQDVVNSADAEQSKKDKFKPIS